MICEMNNLKTPPDRHLKCAFQMTHRYVIWRTHGPKYHLSNFYSKCAFQIQIQITHFALVWKQSMFISLMRVHWLCTCTSYKMHPNSHNHSKPFHECWGKKRLKTLFNIVEARFKKKLLNFDIHIVWWCSDGSRNSQEFKSFEICAVTIKIYGVAQKKWNGVLPTICKRNNWYYCTR